MFDKSIIVTPLNIPVMLRGEDTIGSSPAVVAAVPKERVPDAAHLLWVRVEQARAQVDKALQNAKRSFPPYQTAIDSEQVKMYMHQVRNVIHGLTNIKPAKRAGNGGSDKQGLLVSLQEIQQVLKGLPFPSRGEPVERAIAYVTKVDDYAVKSIEGASTAEILVYARHTVRTLYLARMVLNTLALASMNNRVEAAIAATV